MLNQAHLLELLSSTHLPLLDMNGSTPKAGPGPGLPILPAGPRPEDRGWLGAMDIQQSPSGICRQVRLLSDKLVSPNRPMSYLRMLGQEETWRGKQHRFSDL